MEKLTPIDPLALNTITGGVSCDELRKTQLWKLTPESFERAMSCDKAKYQSEIQE